MLKRHIANEHGMTPQEYRAYWNLSLDHPLVAPNYAAKRAELAKSIGLGRSKGEKVVVKAGRKKPKAAAPAVDGA